MKPREKGLLAALGLVAVVAALRFLGVGSEDFGLLGGGEGGGFEEGIEIVTLDSERLEAPSGEYSVGRNPWAFAPPPRPEPRERPQPSVEQRPEPRPPVERPQPTQDAAPPKPKPPPVDLDYLGSFGPPESRIAVFTDNEETIYNAREGEVINDKFRVSAIGFESVDLEFVGFPDVAPARLQPGGS
jgi:hypothetical protein